MLHKKNFVVLNNRYSLGKRIGIGGLSEVYDAEDMYAKYFQDVRPLVIKVPSPRIAQKKDIAAFVYSEYTLLSSLHHENIVKVVDFGIDDNTKMAYLVMQKLEGKLLVNIALHKITKNMKQTLIFSLYSALVYIHNKGIIHADINPTNIMMNSEGDAQLFDFGISQATGLKEQYNLAYKKVNAYNPLYSAPEVLDGNPPTQKADIFSLACVMFELYEGRLPFKKSSKELETKPFGLKDMKNIPLLQRRWFIKAFCVNPLQRTENIPFCIRWKRWITQKPW